MSAYSDLIDAAAKRYGMGHRSAYMRRAIDLESKGDPKAFNAGSKAAGLLQFLPGTAKDYGLDDPYDPGKSIDAGFRLAKANEEHLKKVLGRDPTDAELYMAHLQGPGGAAKLLSHGDRAATALLGRSAVTGNYGGTDDDTGYSYADKIRAAYDGSSAPAATASASLPDVPQSRITPELLAALMGGGKQQKPAMPDASKLSAGGAFATGLSSSLDEKKLASLFKPSVPAGPGNSMTSTGKTDAAMGNAEQGDWDFKKPTAPAMAGLQQLLSIFL